MRHEIWRTCCCFYISYISQAILPQTHSYTIPHFSEISPACSTISHTLHLLCWSFQIKKSVIGPKGRGMGTPNALSLIAAKKACLLLLLWHETCVCDMTTLLQLFFLFSRLMWELGLLPITHNSTHLMTSLERRDGRKVDPHTHCEISPRRTSEKTLH